MAHQENGYVVFIFIYLSLEHGGDVGEYGGCGAGEPTGRGGSDGATPSALVEAEGLDPARSERGEEGVVGVDVVGETVDEDEDGRWGEVRRLVRFSISADGLGEADALSRFLCIVWYRLVAHAHLPLLYPCLRLLKYALWADSI